APANALILSTADEPTFALWYDRYTAGRRPDVLALDVRLLDQPWFRANMRRYNADVAQALPARPNSLAAFIAAIGRQRPVLSTVGTLVAPPNWRWQPLADGLWQAMPP